MSGAATSSSANPVEHLRVWLYDKSKNPYVENFIVFLEQKTNTKREHLAYALVGIVVTTLLISSIQQIVCNVIGFAYPAYASVKAVRTPTKDDDTQWLCYWVVFALFSLVDLSVFTNIPMYWLVKVVFLLYLYLPSTRGALYLYKNFADPLIAYLEKVVSDKTKTT